MKETASVWSQWVTTFVLIGSVLLTVAFAKDGKTGSALLQTGVSMGLIGSQFDLYNKAQTLKSKLLTSLVTWGWLGTMCALLFGSLYFLVRP